MPAQVVAPLQQLNVCPMARDAPHPGDRMPLGRSHADDDAVRDGKHLRPLQAIGIQHPMHGFLHPVDLRPAGHQLVSQIRGQIEQSVIVHSLPLLLQQNTGFHCRMQATILLQSPRHGAMQREGALLPSSDGHDARKVFCWSIFSF